MHPYGYLYRGRFNLIDPSRNLIVGGYDSCSDGQFRLRSFLEKDTVHILVVATRVEGVAGAFSIVSNGVANVIFTRLGGSDCLRCWQEENSRADGYSRLTCVFCLDLLAVASSTYSSELTVNSSQYFGESCDIQTNYYYQALQILVSESGYYRFSSITDMYIYGYLYREMFDPFDPLRNQVVGDYKSCLGGQFQLYVSLQANIT